MTIVPALSILIVLAVPSTSALPFSDLYVTVNSSRETVEGLVIVAG